ncbi:serine hydrolase [Virgisporangium ochraceum]|uniref:Serine hydrolase n=1 Tax=Virgisporangium ochraceum TaxID=65505 RepID=A0A8J3ZUQ1_9ACTN|nr:serine hydrolase [Virgisporangium ochraceum]
MLVAALVAGSGVTVEAHAGGPTDGNRLRRDVAAVHALGLPGVQARLVGPDGRDVVATAGVADLRTGRPVPPNGRARIASTGKAFIATVVLQLVGEGRMGLDDPVEKWLPGLIRGNGNDGRAITVRHLLQHTSGLHDDVPDFATAADYYAHRYDTYTPADLLGRTLRHPPDFAPGTRWRYSNIGYIVAEMVIDRVTGRPWHEEVRRRVLTKAGMRDTTWPGNDPTLPNPHARGYHEFDDAPGMTDVTEQVIVDGGAAFVSTTADVNRFFRALLGGRLVKPAQLAEMTRTVPLGPEFEELLPGARYGLGLFERPLPCGGTYWSHPGGGSGYTSDNGVTRDGRRSVAVSVSGTRPALFLQHQHTVDRVVENGLCGSGSGGN